MSEETINRLREGFEEFNRTGEIDPDVFDPDVELRQASSIIDTAGSFRGKNGLRDALRELQDAFEDLSFEQEEIIEAPGGEFVTLVRVRGRGRGSGLTLDNEIAWVLTLRGRKVVRIAVYEERAEALDAVGLSR